MGEQWVVVHIVGMIGSYVVLWTAFYVDNAHLFPLFNRLPILTFWVGPTLIACRSWFAPFLGLPYPLSRDPMTHRNEAL